MGEPGKNRSFETKNQTNQQVLKAFERFLLGNVDKQQIQDCKDLTVAKCMRATGKRPLGYSGS